MGGGAMPRDFERQRTEGEEVLFEVGMAGRGRVIMGFTRHS